MAEHENSVDYEGPSFLRRVGLADVDHINDDGADTPAEPSTNRCLLLTGLRAETHAV